MNFNKIAKQKIIIVGSKGVIGKILCNSLSSEFDIYGIDVINENKDRYYQTDISDFDSLKSIFEKIKEIKGIIHLAADSRINADWNSILKNNIIGTKNIYECARISKIKKIIFASSNHVTGCYEGIPPELHNKQNQKLITINDPIKPDSLYSISKAFGEAIARYFFEVHGISSICLRIGSVETDDNPKKDKTKRMLKTWLSHRDLIQLIKKSLESTVGFGIYYGVSNNKDCFWDFSNAEKELGYKPIDDASKL